MLLRQAECCIIQIWVTQRIRNEKKRWLYKSRFSSSAEADRPASMSVADGQTVQRFKLWGEETQVLNLFNLHLHVMERTCFQWSSGFRFIMRAGRFVAYLSDFVWHFRDFLLQVTWMSLLPSAVVGLIWHKTLRSPLKKVVRKKGTMRKQKRPDIYCKLS